MRSNPDGVRARHAVESAYCEAILEARERCAGLGLEFRAVMRRLCELVAERLTGCGT